MLHKCICGGGGTWKCTHKPCVGRVIWPYCKVCQPGPFISAEELLKSGAWPWPSFGLCHCGQLRKPIHGACICGHSGFVGVFCVNCSQFFQSQGEMKCWKCAGPSTGVTPRPSCKCSVCIGRVQFPADAA